MEAQAIPVLVEDNLDALRRFYQLLNYDPVTGIFRWQVTIHSRALAGHEAGTISRAGYRVIQIDGKLYRAARLAWFMVYRRWPENLVDHIDGDKANDRISNLRDVSHSSNMRNQTRAHKGSTSGHIGVSWSASAGKWIVQVVAKGIARRHYGTFDRIEDAVARYWEMKKVLHPDAPSPSPQSRFHKKGSAP